jgi:hypothetical protein
MKSLPCRISIVAFLAAIVCCHDVCMAGSVAESSAASLNAGPDIPMAITECENSGCPATNLGIWTFQGQKGFGTWSDNGAVSTLSVERFDKDGIVIRRLNLQNSAAPNLTAVYTGTFDKNNQIKGTVTWTWSGFKGGVAHGEWQATIGTPQDQQLQLQAQRQRVQQLQTQHQMSDAGALLILSLVNAMLQGSGDSGSSGSDQPRALTGPEQEAIRTHQSYIEKQGYDPGPGGR